MEIVFAEYLPWTKLPSYDSMDCPNWIRSDVSKGVQNPNGCKNIQKLKPQQRENMSVEIKYYYFLKKKKNYYYYYLSDEKFTKVLEAMSRIRMIPCHNSRKNLSTFLLCSNCTSFLFIYLFILVAYI